MLPQEIIRKKRDGGRLSEAQIKAFIDGVTSGAVTEGQIAAFCMAVFFRRMELDERVALTRAMTHSGTVLNWKPLGLPGPVLDKHSTGGVGDKVSLILAPVIAACGGFVPMISGRGLGHTGGTLDKLDSIPGYTSLPDRPVLERVIREVGCAIIGATDAFAPADKRIYAVRDITATVESLDLITASILSKKLAAGLDALVMDVKWGSGAFMAEFDDALALAESIATVASGAGMPTVALLTDMNEVLGRTAGNALEVRESIDLLTGASRDARLTEVTTALSAELLVLGGLAPDEAAARALVDQAIASGAAAERFGRMVAALGGPADLLEHPDRHLDAAPVTLEVRAETDGFVTAIDTRALGVAVVALGGGRTRVQDPIDPAVGLTDVSGLGSEAGAKAAPLAIIHARTGEAAEAAATMVRGAFTVGQSAPKPNPPIARRLTR
ncbi:thymidine phosphorylase [Skermanella stibiiresistens SB22]|uniref:Thymidine phosphorylase n=1 Tax=Skermanella stibiiresistens SB22 TaxID=1385369 RepID=W9H0Z7_9PROT|nr:thymidine phosphorylase [Skermanella stibiiresistens]EWY38382.1 thymidine phosphorylase [Skermanella stibiiresistens SB22]